tara:strand:+ start:747 stop:1130 length:384 start_codon:yes stop_codon:yes gene_type:complete
MSTPFDFINAINFSKEDLFKDNPQADKDYVPFVVNRGLSYFADTLFYANEMNRFPNLSTEAQFFFLKNSISKKKRFSKWAAKGAVSDDLENVCAYYGYSKRQAKLVLNNLTEKQLLIIRESQNKGGK